ncbi:MAG: ATP-binding protein, partial [Gemmatimonadota bacterium]|nr:ATP-binding protein [Gemmatimonadota bacterium]
MAYAIPGIAVLFEAPWHVAPGYYFYPPSGVGIGILCIFGLRLWPAVFFGAVAVTLATGGSFTYGLATGAGNALEAVVAYAIIAGRLDTHFVTVDSVRTFLLALGAGAVVSGIAGTIGLVTTGAGEYSDMPRILWMWSVGHFMGGLLVGGAIIGIHGLKDTYREQLREAIAVLVVLAFVSYAAFASIPGPTGSYPLQYLTYPVLIWAALRLAPGWVMLGNLTVAGTMLFWTSLGVGPISQGSLSLNLAYGATFALVAWLTSSVLAAIVAERKASEKTRLEREGNYRAVVEQALEGIVVIDQDGICTDVNGAGARLFDRAADRMIGRPFIEFVPVESRGEIQRVLDRAHEEDAPHLVEWVYNDRRDPVWIEASIKQIDASRTQVFARNITRRRSLERQVAEAQKMEAVGLLAGGVAHDFNNLLTVVLGQAGRAQAFVDAGDPAFECIDEVIAAARKSADLTKQLLTFARKHAGEPTTLDVNQVLEDRNAMIRQLLGERIRYVLTQERSGDGRLWVNIDPVGLEQVILNLVINAKDAMEEGGELKIGTRAVTVPGLGDAVEISVQDVGHGMTPKTAKRIFEPFFTTKEERNRTGLGLAVSYGIISNAGGTIDCSSVPDQGTEFTLLLPRTTAPAPVRTVAPGDQTSGSGRGEWVLVIEDEAPVRELITVGLIEAGYNVVGAPDGESAIEAHRGAEAGIDLVVSDVILPGRSGPETVRTIQSECPTARAMFISGYDDN